MPYAADDYLGAAPIDGAIEITPQQYQQALAALAAGQRVAVCSGTLRLLVAERRTVWSTADGTPLEIAANDDTPSGHTDTPPPSARHVMAAGAWVLDLPAWRADLRAAIQAAHGRHHAAGCAVAVGEQSCQIGTDGETHALLARWAEDLADSQDTRLFGTRCGKAMEVDAALAATGRDAIAAHWDACAARLHALLEAVADATDAEALEAVEVQVDDGWPEASL